MNSPNVVLGYMHLLCDPLFTTKIQQSYRRCPLPSSKKTKQKTATASLSSQNQPKANGEWANQQANAPDTLMTVLQMQVLSLFPTESLCQWLNQLQT